MTQETRRRKWRWLRHVAWILGAKIFLIVAGLMIFFGSGAGNPPVEPPAGKPFGTDDRRQG